MEISDNVSLTLIMMSFLMFILIKTTFPIYNNTT